MHIAIIGATSQIAKDLIESFAAQDAHTLELYARRPHAVKEWLANVNLTNRHTIHDYDAFRADNNFDAILNFVGVGNPAQTSAMGASIFDVTLKYDDLALDYVRQNPACRYIFLSSGAVYGSSFVKPADVNTNATIDINCLQPHDWYGMAKLHAECRHRSLAHLPIIDIRVFNYFSHTQNISARFFITDILRAIQSGETLMTTPENIVRDYIGPDDFFKLISLILESPAANNVFDCYTKAPVDKMTLLTKMKENFGLSYAIQKEPVGINATGVKINYFSQNFRASTLGYVPSLNSLETIYKEYEKKINIT